MSATVGKPKPQRGPTLGQRFQDSPAFDGIATAGGIAQLAYLSFRYALTPPFKWVPEAFVQISLTMRRCLMPLAISLIAFVIGYGFFVLGGIAKVIGASDKEGGAFIIGFLREASVWVSGMVFAGVAGSAIASDLGARKIREELDALAVLGVSGVRNLVVPRVIAGAIAAPLLGVLSVLFIEAANFALAPSQFGFTRGVLLASTKGSLVTLDIYGALIRYFIIGIFVASCSCYKGLNVKGGTEGVGKAVNQTIVICFFFVWMLDALFNLAYLSLFPEIQVDFKG